MTDPAENELMVPPKFWTPFSSKTPLLESDYYEMVDQRHFKLVHLQETPVFHFTGDGVATSDVVNHETDNISGHDDKCLPNVLFLYGPQAPSSFTNGPLFIEMQVDWIIDVLKRAESDAVDCIEPSHEAVQQYVDKIWAGHKGSIFEQDESWLVGSNIPVKKKEPQL
ncbi:hypothetical protein Daus18300_014379 [Diaporthe australafricana]|uniref:Uncharacterized protein n=1 Tax=Diaporthe australafricana TaxID=127596 RepID=A0ABR3VVH5_9PEZI